LDGVDAEVLALIEEATQTALAAPAPDPVSDLARDVYLKYA
jgi:hypothetical protein